MQLLFNQIALIMKQLTSNNDGAKRFVNKFTQENKLQLIKIIEVLNILMI